MVNEFHEKFGYTIGDKPALLKKSLLRFRADFITEEADEFHESVEEEDLTRMVDALGDLLYFVYGTAVALGVDMEPVFAEIHRSNMTKEVAQSKDAKGVKGPGYSPPDLSKVLFDQGGVV